MVRLLACLRIALVQSQKLPSSHHPFLPHAIPECYQSNDFIVIAAEDKYQPDENEMTTATIPSDDVWKAPAAVVEVIVGVASIKLELGSKLNGFYKNN